MTTHSILFAGSDPIALPTLERLTKRGWVGAVLSAPPRRQGRHGSGGMETAVTEYAHAHRLLVLQYEKLNQTACSDVVKLGCNGLVCVAYGRYFPPAFLALFPSPTTETTQPATEASSSIKSLPRAVGTMNLHPSLLPRFRGASPIAATLLSGDSHGGVSIIRIAKEMDGGAILAQERVAITSQTTRKELGRWCAERGAAMIEQLLLDRSSESAPHGTIDSVPQNEAEAVWCRKITRDHGQIEWSLPAEMILRQLLAFQRWPGSFTTFRGKRLIIHQATIVDSQREAPPKECGTIRSIDSERGGICVQSGRGIIAVERLQLEYKPPVDWQSFVNGYSLVSGDRLG